MQVSQMIIMKFFYQLMKCRQGKYSSVSFHEPQTHHTVPAVTIAVPTAVYRRVLILFTLFKASFHSLSQQYASSFNIFCISAMILGYVIFLAILSYLNFTNPCHLWYVYCTVLFNWVTNCVSNRFVDPCVDLMNV
jgi:hypothetical protein